jgi:hypothetical protein
LLADHVDDHQVAAAQTGDPATRAVGDVGDLVVTGPIVHRLEHVRAGDTQGAGVEFGSHPFVVVGEVADRTELAPAVAGLADLGEHLFPRWGAGLVRQVDTPRNRPVGNPQAHVRPLSYRRGRRLHSHAMSTARPQMPTRSA